MTLRSNVSYETNPKLVRDLVAAFEEIDAAKAATAAHFEARRHFKAKTVTSETVDHQNGRK